MSRVRAMCATAAIAITLAGFTGCGSGSGGHPPTPQRTVIRGYRTYTAGQTGVLASPSQHASLRITIGRPTRSASRLSSTYGLAPKFGHYLTFGVTIRNTGRATVAIRSLDFSVRSGASRTTVNDGNAPFSGAASQLDSTELAPGQRVTSDLTFDVAVPAGWLFYAPGGHPALAWRF